MEFSIYAMGNRFNAFYSGMHIDPGFQQHKEHFAMVNQVQIRHGNPGSADHRAGGDQDTSNRSTIERLQATPDLFDRLFPGSLNSLRTFDTLTSHPGPLDLLVDENVTDTPPSLEASAQYRKEIDTSQPILLDRQVSPRTPTALELIVAADRAQQRLDRGDRGGAYLELYKVTGSEQILLQAQITTYSGAVGGMALEGNFRAKMANPDDYTLTLDQFSHDIDQAVVTLARQTAEAGEPENFNTLAIMETDSLVWKNNNMIEHFPGNAQFIGIAGYEYLAESTGSEVAILSQDEIELGRRPAEYANDPRFTTTTSLDGRFITVVNNETNRIEAFFDNQFESDRGSVLDAFHTPDLEQLENAIPSQRIAAERQMKMEFLQAGTMAPKDALPSFDSNAHRPPENLDRVFVYDGKHYQVSDSTLFDRHGVDIGALTRNEGLWAGIKFGAALNEVGLKVEDIIENRYSRFDTRRQHDFQTMVNDGIITPLSDTEIAYYENNVESVGSPYQSTDDAMKGLGSSLYRPIMYLGDNQLDDLRPDTGDSEST